MDTFFAQLLTFHDSSRGSLLSADFLGTVKLTFKILTLVLFLALLFVMYRMTRLRSPVRPLEQVTQSLRGSVVPRNRLAMQWEKIGQRLQKPTEAEWKIAIIEADNLVDDVLRRMGYPGTTMGERLKNITPAQFQSINNIWAAHKMRNRIVHDPNSHMPYKDAREAIANYSVFLKEAHILE